MQYRSFLNCDPPGIVDVWRSQPPLHGRAQPLSTNILEQQVLAKPYFDPAGLIVAVDHEQIVGFAHAGFGVDDNRRELSRELGIVCTVLVSPHDQHDEIAAQLLARAEDYLRRLGAKLIYAGGIHPLDPFYLGLYGGSEMPGLLKSDEKVVGLFTSQGYRQIDSVAVFERDLAGFRPPVERKLLQVRRRYRLEATFDPPAANWWDACTYGQTDRTRFVLRLPGQNEPVCSVTFWDMEPLAQTWGVPAVGLVQLFTAESARRQGLATFLIGEALRQLHAHGVARCQVQCMRGNIAAQALYRKLGFNEIDEGLVLRKEE